MTFKIVGSSLIVFSSYLYGMIKSNELNEQIKILKQFKNDMIFLKNSIEFSKRPISEIIKGLSQEDTTLKSLYKSFAEQIDNCEIDTSWKECVDKFKTSTKNKKIFLQFTELFSVMDIKGQIELFDNYIISIDKEISDTDAYAKKNDKLIKNLGFYVGILTVVLLI